MAQLFAVTAMVRLPMAVLCGILCFAAAQWSLQWKCKMIGRACVLLCLAAMAAGIMYGVLRFSGIILFADDLERSTCWFGSSWRDDGFGYMYGCGPVFAGATAALFFRRREKYSAGHG